MGKKSFNLDSVYKQAAHLSGAETEIEQLQAEVERLRAAQNPDLEKKLEKLRQQLAESYHAQDIDVDDIGSNPNQPRKTFSSESIRAMAQSLSKDGQLEPIIVMKVELRDQTETGKNFQLFDGERRWRAAKQLQWKTMRAVNMPRPQDLHRKSLLTTLHREDLNSLDKAEALLKEISTQTEIETDEILRILSAAMRRLDYQKRGKWLSELVTKGDEERQQGLEQLELSEPEQSVLNCLLELGLNPASVLSNDLRTLSLPSDLQAAIRQNGLKTAHALSLQRLSAKKLKASPENATEVRKEATAKVLEQNLSIKETRELVRKFIEQYSPLSSERETRKQATTVMHNLEQLSLSGIERTQLQEFRQGLLAKLTEIEELLGEENI